MKGQGSNMEYRILGKTGLKVSALSFGASSLGSMFREVEESKAIETVRTALDLGINFIDVSPFYGLTRAETVLGKALKGVPRDSYYLATKLGRYGDDLESFDFSLARVKSSIDESLQRMGVDCIDIIQCHDIEYGDLDQVVNEAIPAMREVQKEGKVGFVGITGLPLKPFSTVINQVDVDTIQSYCHYCLNDTALADMLPYLKSKDMGIISSAPLAMRLLSGGTLPDWHPSPQEVRDGCSKAVAYCKERGEDISKLALQFSLANPDIHAVFVGTANPDRIRQNVAWAEEPLDETLLAEVLAMLKPVHNMTWPSGRPENNGSWQ